MFGSRKIVGNVPVGNLHYTIFLEYILANEELSVMNLYIDFPELTLSIGPKLHT